MVELRFNVFVKEVVLGWIEGWTAHVLEQVWQQISLKLCEPQLLRIFVQAWYMSTQRSGRTEVDGIRVLYTGQLRNWISRLFRGERITFGYCKPASWAAFYLGIRACFCTLPTDAARRRRRTVSTKTDYKKESEEWLTEVHAPVRQFASCRLEVFPRRDCPWQRRRHCRVCSSGRGPWQFSLCARIETLSMRRQEGVRVCSPFTVPELWELEHLAEHWRRV